MSDTNLYKTLKRYQRMNEKSNADIAQELNIPNIIFYFSRWEKRGIKGVYKQIIFNYLKSKGFIEK